MSNQSIPVLMYHHVSPNPGLVTVSPQTFAVHMEHVQRAGYHTLSADKFLAFLRGKQTVPTRSILITFDDGFLDNYVYAFPELKKRGLRATIFVVTSWAQDAAIRPHAGETTSPPPTPDHKSCKAAINSGRADEVMMRWSEMVLAEKAGVFEIHSHTHSHIRWDEKFSDPMTRNAELERDLITSRETLRQRLGKDSLHLCWPWGHREEGYESVAAKAGFAAQYTTERGINVVHDNPAHVKRLVMKDRPDGWFAQQLWIYRNPLMARLYLLFRGRK
jgi:peptidoglycan/xylan/chitin deacetylase (PgdA/CDA1 family)